MLREGIPIGELTSWSLSIETLSSVRIPPSSTAATRELRLVLACDLKLPALVLDFIEEPHVFVCNRCLVRKGCHWTGYNDWARAA